MTKMTDLNFSISQGTLEDTTWIDTKIDEFNIGKLSFTGKKLEIPLNYVVKDNNKIIAGIKCCFYLEEVLYVNVIFVDENYRLQRLGSLLLNKVEDEAIALGAKLAHLYTFDFQAKDFYLKHGYIIFGVLEDCPVGHTCYYLKKKLQKNKKKL